MSLFGSESERLKSFPVARKRIFLAHAGVTALPACASEAMISYISSSSEDQQEFGGVLKEVSRARSDSSVLLGVSDEEIASPVASSPEVVIAMNQPSFVRFQGALQSGDRKSVV